MKGTQALDRLGREHWVHDVLANSWPRWFLHVNLSDGALDGASLYILSLLLTQGLSSHISILIFSCLTVKETFSHLPPNSGRVWSLLTPHTVTVLNTPSPQTFFSRPAATNAWEGLKGPQLVPGKPGGAVTIQCHYKPSAINRHQRKYWCRRSPLTQLCHTVVSTNHYTHHRYVGRVALTDFPQRGLFVVRLSQLSPDDVGSYRCGIGNRNSVWFFSMNLTISAGMG